jgi:hypothetical protein
MMFKRQWLDDALLAGWLWAGHETLYILNDKQGVITSSSGLRHSTSTVDFLLC